MIEDASIYPLLALNVGCEVVFVLRQRLLSKGFMQKQVTSILFEVTRNVLAETTLVPHRLDRTAMRSVVQRAIDVRIMRLDATSIQKLYELVVMTFKYQLVSCRTPKELLFLTLNHLDVLRTSVISSDRLAFETVYSFLEQKYGRLRHADWRHVWQRLLNLTQDQHVRISVLVDAKLQGSDGRFVVNRDCELAPEIDLPGFVEIHDPSGHVRRKQLFRVNAEPCKCVPAMGMNGQRGTKLGTNLYTKISPSSPTKPSPTTASSSEPTKTNDGNERSLADTIQGDSIKSVELLERMMGDVDVMDDLDLFHDEAEDGQGTMPSPGRAQRPSEVQEIHIDTTDAMHLSHVQGILDEFSREGDRSSPALAEDNNDDLLGMFGALS